MRLRCAGFINDRAEEIVLGLIQRAGGRNALPQALFGQGGARSNAGVDIHALRAWCLWVVGQARAACLEGQHRKGSISFEFLEEVARLSTFRKSPQLAREKLARHGIALVVAPDFLETCLDGAALRTKEQVPVVGMTVRYDRLDKFWFCLLLELAQFWRHIPDGNGEVFIDDLQICERDHAVDDVREREADEWVQDAFIPAKLWKDNTARLHPSVANVVDLAHQANSYPAVVAGRIRYERRSYSLLLQFVGANEIRALQRQRSHKRIKRGARQCFPAVTRSGRAWRTPPDLPRSPSTLSWPHSRNRRFSCPWHFFFTSAEEIARWQPERSRH